MTMSYKKIINRRSEKRGRVDSRSIEGGRCVVIEDVVRIGNISWVSNREAIGQLGHWS